MKVLLVIEEYAVRKIGDRYYHSSLPTHLDRYRVLGDITLCTQIKEQSSLEGLSEISDVELIRIFHSNSLFKLIKYSRNNKSIIKKAVQNADLVIGYVPSFLSNYALKCAKKEGKPTLMVAIACPWDALWNHSVKGKFIAPIAMFTMKNSLKKTDAALYVTTEFLQKRYPTKGYQIGISDVDLVDTDKSIIENRVKKIKSLELSNKETEIKIITSAAINVRYKRQEDVIKAIAILKDKYNLHYYLAGYGDCTYLKSIANKFGVTNRVHFLGMLNHNEIFRTLQEMDIYIQPSKQEGLPRALVEAMSMGLPSIGSNAGGIPELLSGKWIFRKGKANDLAMLIDHLLKKDELIMSARENFNKAKNFNKSYLNEKRKDFLKTLKEHFNIE